MRLHTFSSRGNWLLAGEVWVALCWTVWAGLPVMPRARIPGRSVHAFEFSGDSNTLLTLAWPDPFVIGNEQASAEFRTWSCDSGQSIGTPLPFKFSMYLHASVHSFCSPNRRWWYLGPSARQAADMLLLNIADRRIEKLLVEPTDDRTPSAFTPDGRLVVETGVKDKEALALCNPDNKTVIGRIAGAQLPMAASRDGKRLVATDTQLGAIKSVRVFDGRTLKPIVTLSGENREIFADLAMSDDGGIVAATFINWHDYSPKAARSVYQSDRIGRVWSVPDGRVLFSTEKITSYALIGGDRPALLAIGREPHVGPVLQRFNARTGELQKTGRISGGPVATFEPESISPDQSRVIVTQFNPKRSPLKNLARKLGLSLPKHSVREFMHLAVYNTATCQLETELPGTRGRWSPNGRLLATYERSEPDADLLIWDYPPRKPVGYFTLISALLGLPIALLTCRRERLFSA